jgi:hypothetical protein
MQGLRGNGEVDLAAGRLLGLLAGRPDLDGEVGAAELAHLASDAELGPLDEDLARFEDENLLRAERDADPATFAVPLANYMIESLCRLIAHRRPMEYMRNAV